jgi:hypothetical protein
LLGVRDGEIDVVLSGQDGFSFFFLEMPEDLIDFDLVVDIQVGTGFIKEEEWSVLG